MYVVNGPGAQARGGLASVEPVEILGGELREPNVTDLGYEALAADLRSSPSRVSTDHRRDQSRGYPEDLR